MTNIEIFFDADTGTPATAASYEVAEVDERRKVAVERLSEGNLLGKHESKLDLLLEAGKANSTWPIPDTLTPGTNSNSVPLIWMAVLLRGSYLNMAPPNSSLPVSVVCMLAARPDRPQRRSHSSNSGIRTMRQLTSGCSSDLSCAPKRANLGWKTERPLREC